MMILELLNFTIQTPQPRMQNLHNTSMLLVVYDINVLQVSGLWLFRLANYLKFRYGQKLFLLFDFCVYIELLNSY